jgi:hypothetical protein
MDAITKKIHVRVLFEMCVNGKDLKSYGKENGYDMLSDLNKGIIRSFEDMDDALSVIFDIFYYMHPIHYC